MWYNIISDGIKEVLSQFTLSLERHSCVDIQVKMFNSSDTIFNWVWEKLTVELGENDVLWTGKILTMYEKLCLNKIIFCLV